MRNPIIEQARRLRRDRTLAEHILWRQLQRRQCAGCKFRFQHPIPPYIVDFVCFERRLIVEVDGGQHGGYLDSARTAYLEQKGFSVLRVWNNEVLENLDGVYSVIERALCGVLPSP